MPKELFYSIVATIVLTILFITITYGSSLAVNRDIVTSFAFSALTFCTIATFLKLLYDNEKVSEAEFGKVIRANMNTIITSLVLNLFFSLIVLWEKLIIPLFSLLSKT